MYNEERKRDKSKKEIENLYNRCDRNHNEYDQKNIYTFSKSKSKSKSKERENDSDLKQSDCRRLKSKIVMYI
jgi:hypothetical protein